MCFYVIKRNQRDCVITSCLSFLNNDRKVLFGFDHKTRIEKKISANPVSTFAYSTVGIDHEEESNDSNLHTNAVRKTKLRAEHRLQVPISPSSGND